MRQRDAVQRAEGKGQGPKARPPKPVKERSRGIPGPPEPDAYVSDSERDRDLHDFEREMHDRFERGVPFSGTHVASLRKTSDLSKWTGEEMPESATCYDCGHYIRVPSMKSGGKCQIKGMQRSGRPVAQPLNARPCEAFKPRSPKREGGLNYPKVGDRVRLEEYDINEWTKDSEKLYSSLLGEEGIVKSINENIARVEFDRLRTTVPVDVNWIFHVDSSKYESESSRRTAGGIRLDEDGFGDYVLTEVDEDGNETGEDLLVQTDWDYPATAANFGWDLGASEDGCDHRYTDGTIACPDCGKSPGDFITQAAEYLDDHIGDEAEDPGYFESLASRAVEDDPDEYDGDAKNEAITPPPEKPPARRKRRTYQPGEKDYYKARQRGERPVHYFWGDDFKMSRRSAIGDFMEDEDELERVECPECGGEGAFMGNLGKKEWFRCVDCGIDFSRPREVPKTADYTFGQKATYDNECTNCGWGCDAEEWEEMRSEGIPVCKKCGHPVFKTNYFPYGVRKTRERRERTADYTSQDGMMDGGWGSTVTQDSWAWDKDPEEYKICEGCGQEFKTEPFAYSGWDRLCRVCSRTAAARAGRIVEIVGRFSDWVQDHAPASKTAGQALARILEEENPGHEVMEIWSGDDGEEVVAYLRPKENVARRGRRRPRRA